MYDINSVPKEVIEVWGYQMSKQSIGMETYKRLQDTIETYPEYFPQETIYKTIPQEVHDKYYEEKKELRLKFYPRKESDIQPGEGLWDWARRQEAAPIKITNLDIKELAEKISVTAPKIKKQYETEKRKLWNKHYKKYKLRYEE
jgi:hypothetical protein